LAFLVADVPVVVIVVAAAGVEFGGVIIGRC
jgi:hypothetical protein